MTDLIEIKKVDGKVILVNTILKNQDHDYVLNYVIRHYAATMRYQDYGFDKPILGIGPSGCGFLDDSEKFFGRGYNDGLVMICPSRDEMKEYGLLSDLYLMYDDEDLTEDRIYFD